jgi:hypothetical protein
VPKIKFFLLILHVEMPNGQALCSFIAALDIGGA